MSHLIAVRRWTVALLLTGTVGLAMAGCVVAPAGGGYPYDYGYAAGPNVYVSTPGVVVAPGAPGYHRYYRHGYYRSGYWHHGYGG